MIDSTRITKSLGFTELKSWLRHRHPMILLDRILDHEPGKFLKGVVCVSGALDTIAGHFPERAVFPGSHLIQSFSQAGIILFQMSTAKLEDDEMTVVSSVSAKFFKPVVPGDRIIMQVNVDKLEGNTIFLSGKATVDDKRVGAFRVTLAKVMVSDMGNPLW